ncbi:MAG: tetratricopeptide repeat protein, partial [Myxococcota bacterium]
MIIAPVLLTLSALGAAAPTPLERAEVALDAGDLAQASDILDEALAADPDDVDALWAAARLELRRDHRERGIELLRRVLDLDPYNDEAHFDLAQALFDDGERAAARASVDSLLERHPQYPPALLLKLGMDGYIAAPSARRSPWRPQLRAGVSAGYDSNLALDPGTVEAA